MKMIFVFVLVLTMVVNTEAGICGNHGQCLCSRSGEVICGDVETAPYFIVSQRPGKRMTLSTRRDFEMDSLTETEGLDHVLLIGPSPSECATAALDFPWVVCPGGTTTGKTTETARKTTETPRLTRSARTELTTGTATTDQVTTETGESAAQDQDKKEGKRRLNGVIAWSVISAFFGFVTTICILVGEYVWARIRGIVIIIMVRVTGRLIMLYVWNPNLAPLFDNVDEDTLWLIVILKFMRGIVYLIEQRQGRGPNRPHNVAPPHVRAPPADNARPDLPPPAFPPPAFPPPLGLAQPMRRAAPVIIAQPRARQAAQQPRQLAGLDPGNILPRRLR